jgi:hypothetical protein
MNRATFRTLTAAVGLHSDADKAEFFGVSTRAVQRWGALPRPSRNELPNVVSDLPEALETQLMNLIDSFNEEAGEAIASVAEQPPGSSATLELSTHALEFPEHIREALKRYIALRLVGEGFRVNESFRL